MKLKLSKCKVLQTKVEKLGHLVSEEQMIPSYIQKILEWPIPTTRKQLKQFLGFIENYLSFIPDISNLTFKMNSMKAQPQLVWDENTLRKFKTLKQRFQEGPFRAYPD